jgi:hypothetical protein
LGETRIADGNDFGNDGHLEGAEGSWEGHGDLVDPADCQPKSGEEVVLDIIICPEWWQGYLLVNSFEMTVHLFPSWSCRANSFCSSQWLHSFSSVRPLELFHTTAFPSLPGALSAYSLRTVLFPVLFFKTFFVMVLEPPLE